MDVTASFSYAALVKEQYTSPRWVDAPTMSGSATTSSITAYMKSNTVGEACGVCLNNSV